MRNKNFVLVDYGPIALCKDGVEVYFEDQVDFEKHVGEVAASFAIGKEYFWYSPDDSHVKDSLDESVTWSGPIANLDGLINLVPTLAAQKADPYFGLSDDDKFASKMADLRLTRKGRLYNSDWSQVADSPLSAEEKQQWADYRQFLRDVTEGVTTSEGVDEKLALMDAHPLSSL